MLNVSLLNTTQPNSTLPTSILTVADYDDLEFNGYSLQNDNVISTGIKIDSAPSRELLSFRTPRDHGGSFTGDYFRERRIRVTGWVKAATAAALQTALDEMKRSLCVSEGDLDYKVNGEIRRIQATLDNPDQMFAGREGYNVTVCPFELEFLALDPFLHDLDYISLTKLNYAGLVLNESAENLGTMEADSVLVVIVEAAVGITAFTFENTSNGQKVIITTPLAAGDILVIDGEGKSITKNGVEVEYDGTFPKIDYGPNTYRLTATGTSIQYTSTLKFKQAYL